MKLIHAGLRAPDLGGDLSPWLFNRLLPGAIVADVLRVPFVPLPPFDPQRRGKWPTGPAGPRPPVHRPDNMRPVPRP